jgi:excisionase family DNA binding protein
MGIARIYLPGGISIMSSDHTELRLLTLTEAAAILQVSKRTLFRMIQQKQVPAFKVGGQWRIRETQFKKWLESAANQDQEKSKPSLDEPTSYD